MNQVLDCSAGWPKTISPFVGLVRYLGTPGRSKNITRAELDYRRLHNQPVAFVVEFTAGWMLGGFNAGVFAGQQVLSDWTVNLGQPDGQLPGVFAADDVDTAATQLRVIDECLQGVASVLGAHRTFVYGEADVIDHCVGVSKTAKLGWQTKAWSGGRVTSLACLVQQVGGVTVDGVDCDRNNVQAPYWGQMMMEADMPSPKDWDKDDWAAFHHGMLYEVEAEEGRPNSAFPNKSSVMITLEGIRAAVDKLSTVVAPTVDVQQLSKAILDDLLSRIKAQQ